MSVVICRHIACIQSVGEEHRKEMEGLQKKLKWYAENQQWLDKDSARLRQKDAEIAHLTEKLQQLRTDVSHFTRCLIHVAYFPISHAIISSSFRHFCCSIKIFFAACHHAVRGPAVVRTGLDHLQAIHPGISCFITILCYNIFRVTSECLFVLC